MRLRLILGGTITSTEPVKALVSGPSTAARLLKVGQAVDFEVEGRRDSSGRLPVMTGKVSRIDSNSSTDLVRVEVDLAGSPPEGTTVGTRLGTLLDTGEELRDIVLFERPGDARPNTDSTVFVLEAGDAYAKRITVRYGRQSGAQMEIISGLVPGDRVIVTDMSAWAGYPRVKLQ